MDMVYPRGDALKALREKRLESLYLVSCRCGISQFTLARMEAGKPCWLETLRTYLGYYDIKLYEATKYYTIEPPDDDQAEPTT
jgi:hypothetical protein